MGNCFNCFGYSTSVSPTEHKKFNIAETDEENMMKVRAQCIFCNIPKDRIVYENENVYIIKDHNPATQLHFLAIPRSHIPSSKRLHPKHLDIVKELHHVAETFMTNHAPESIAKFGFHIPPFNSIEHLHMHCIAGSPTSLFRGRIAFMPSSPWFRTADIVIRQLEKND